MSDFHRRKIVILEHYSIISTTIKVMRGSVANDEWKSSAMDADMAEK